MASVSGVSGSNTSSIYGSRNVLSGLATGMDTESMIENAVSGYKTKVSSLQQRQTTVQWKQAAMREISNPMVQFAKKYTSYTSSTNLLSASFFDNAVTTTTTGANKDAISATGKTNSSVEILGVKSLATTATYSAMLGGGVVGGTAEAAKITGKLDFGGSTVSSNLSGMLSLSYGNLSATLDLTFGEDEIYADGQAFVDAINEKLKDATITVGNTEYSGDKAVSVSYDEATGAISFKDKLAGNSVGIGSATGKLKNVVNGAQLDLNKLEDGFTSTTNNADVLDGATMKVTVNGKTKTIALPTYDPDSSNPAGDFVGGINTALKKAFGDSVGAQLDVTTGEMSITAGQGSTISIETSGGVRGILGYDSATKTSYTDISKSMSSILGAMDPDYDPDGDYSFNINGVDFTFEKDASLETIMNTINSNEDVGVNVTYSRTTNSFHFKAEESGSAGRIEISSKTSDGKDNLAAKLFGTTETTNEDGTTSSYIAGEDAVLSMKVNGIVYENATRTDNTFSVDGLNITLQESFGYDEAGALDKTAEAVKFTTTSDADKIVSAITDMVTDLNKILNSVHDAYATTPALDSSGNAYEPLTSDQEAELSESAVKNYEEKAKQGILFGDRDLTALYKSLRDTIASSGNTKAALANMGISTEFSNGVTTLTVDETKLRSALSNNPDSVKNAFTGENGLMQKLNSTLNTYAGTTGATKGILIEKAGSIYSALSLLSNDYQDQLESLDKQISKWQEKLVDKIDYYSQQFTRLEVLTSQMNSQSSVLAGLMGS